MVSLFLEIFKNDDVILPEELSPGNLFSDALFRQSAINANNSSVAQP
ncbi:hypothetical protein T4D_11804 [Trichinella pseudospiralis]|uniref:Uncharacterized protein n=1 Tax=Trichinella pseudospiralis TaxID=6337 RepID=A0A0V1F263_TRIPS|nr:hypothetical protein T4D_11804 [Trichinella pseudospiralis]